MPLQGPSARGGVTVTIRGALGGDEAPSAKPLTTALPSALLVRLGIT